jgi:hypothetical protein
MRLLLDYLAARVNAANRLAAARDQSAGDGTAETGGRAVKLERPATGRGTPNDKDRRVRNV